MVVSNCFKDNNAACAQRVNLTHPRHPKPLNQSSPKFAWMNISGIPTTKHNFNFVQIRKAVSLLCMHDFVHPVSSGYFSLFGGRGYFNHLQRGCPQWFWHVICQECDSAQGCAFKGSENQNLKFGPHFLQNPAISGLILNLFSTKNWSMVKIPM